MILTNINPATGEVLGTVAEGDAVEVDLAVEAAEKAFLGGGNKKRPSERAAILRKISDLILQCKDDLARTETFDTGKPLSPTTNIDISRTAGSGQYFANLLYRPWAPRPARWKLAPCLATGRARSFEHRRHRTQSAEWLAVNTGRIVRALDDWQGD